VNRLNDDRRSRIAPPLSLWERAGVRAARLLAVMALGGMLSLAPLGADDKPPRVDLDKTDAPAAQPDSEKKSDGKEKADAKNAEEKKAAGARKADNIQPLDRRAMIRKLNEAAEIRADKTSLKDVLAKLSKQHNVPIQIDDAALKNAGVATDVPITATIKNLTLRAALTQLLKDLKLRHTAKDGVIVVTADVEVQDLAKVGKAHVERKAEEAQERAERVAAAVQQAAAAPARPGMVIDPAQAAADIDELQKQFSRQFRAALAVELNFIRKVCEPTDEQLDGMKEVLEKYRTDIIQKYSDAHKRAARQGRVVGNPFPNEPRDMVRKSLARTVKTNLTAEQVARFDQEAARRKDDRRQAAVDTVVSRLDQDLSLSAEQRDRLRESLAGNWNTTWADQFEQFLKQPGSQFVPAITERLITPVLTGTQKKIWRASKEANQNNQGVIFLNGGNFVGGAAIQVDVLGDSDLDGDDADEEKKE